MKTNRNMNTIMKTFLYLPMAALLITTALAGPASAEEGVPFKGRIEGTEDFTFQAPENGIDLLINGSGGGNATHLGKFTASWDGFIDTTGEVENLIFRTFVAANGDELWSVGPGEGTPPDPDQFVVEDHIIIGGTGRFEGATGSFTVERCVFDVGNPGITDLVTVGSFDGTIILAH